MLAIAGRLTKPVLLILAALAMLLCWNGVSWAFRGADLFLFSDEVGNLSVEPRPPYRLILYLFPEQIYNDRPVGLALEWFLFDRFGFHYTAQLRWFLLIHFANCILALLLFRRVQLSWPLSLAAVALAGSVTTTAATATYIGAVFDVLCLFLLLASALTLLHERLWSRLASALFFLLALRTKEFAIMAPAVFTVLIAYRVPAGTFRQRAAGILRALWPHYLITIVFAVRYAAFLPKMRAEISAFNPYYLDFTLSTAVRSLAYYTGCIFGADQILGESPAVVAFAFVAVLAYSIVRRRGAIVFALSAYLLLLLPVAFLVHMRSLFYVYAPQFFLILAASLLIQDLILLIPRERMRSAVTVAVALAILAAAAGLRRSTLFRAEVSFVWSVRAACARSAQNVAAKLPVLGSDAHVYVRHESGPAWLFGIGDCHYLNVLHHTISIRCFLDPASFAADPSPHKYLLDYHEDGSFDVVARPGAP